MKRLLSVVLATVVAALVGTPVTAKQGNQGHRVSGPSSHAKASPVKSSKANLRSNKGGKVKGRERAEQVQEMNTRADSRRGFAVAPGVEKAEGEQPAKKIVKAHK